MQVPACFLSLAICLGAVLSSIPNMTVIVSFPSPYHCYADSSHIHLLDNSFSLEHLLTWPLPNPPTLISECSSQLLHAWHSLSSRCSIANYLPQRAFPSNWTKVGFS
jgi:hypothetical protein